MYAITKVDQERFGPDLGKAQIELIGVLLGRTQRLSVIGETSTKSTLFNDTELTAAAIVGGCFDSSPARSLDRLRRRTLEWRVVLIQSYPG